VPTILLLCLLALGAWLFLREQGLRADFEALKRAHADLIREESERLRKEFADRASLEGYAARIVRLEDQSRLKSGAANAYLAAVLVLGRRIEAGSPFERELSAALAVAPTGEVAALEKLKPHAKAGVRNAKDLLSAYDPERALLRSERETASEGWIARAWLALKGLIKIRRIGAAPAGSEEESAARTQGLLESGDLPAADKAFEPLAEYEPEFASDLKAAAEAQKIAAALLASALEAAAKSAAGEAR